MQIRDIAKSAHINRTIFDYWYQNFCVNHLSVSNFTGIICREPRVDESSMAFIYYREQFL